MESKYDVGDEIYVKAKVIAVGSRAIGKVGYEIESDALHRIHGFKVGRMFINEDDAIEIPVVEYAVTHVVYDIQDDGAIELTAGGDNLEDDLQYKWLLHFDDQEEEYYTDMPILELVRDDANRFIAAEKVTVVVGVGDTYTSDEMTIKENMDVAITGIDVNDDDGIILTATGQNLPNDETYTWKLDIDGVAYAETSTGPEIVLQETTVDAYADASEVSATVTVGDYTSDSINLKGV